MPRAKKTLTGGTGQAAQPFTGQTYGEGVRQQALQEAMPAPKVSAPSAPAPTEAPQPAEQPVDTAVAPRPRMDMAALREQLAGVGGVLTRPDDQPDVPFNRNLDNPMVGATKPYVNKTGQIMRDLSMRTGDPLFAELAARAGL